MGPQARASARNGLVSFFYTDTRCPSPPIQPGPQLPQQPSLDWRRRPQPNPSSPRAASAPAPGTSPAGTEAGEGGTVCVLVTSTRLHVQKHLWHDRGESSPAAAQEDSQQHTARALKTLQTEAESAAQSVCVQDKQKQEVRNNNMLVNTQPETPLAPHTTVYGPNTTLGALQCAGCVYNHRRHNRHRHQIRPPHTRLEGPVKHPVHHEHCTT